jgi:hypothetical protein
MFDELCDRLTSLFQEPHDSASVFRIRQVNILENEDLAGGVARNFLALNRMPTDVRPRPLRVPGKTIFALPENVRVHAYHPSGAIQAMRQPDAEEGVEREVDEMAVVNRSMEMLRALDIESRVSSRIASENLRFEKLWRVKACGSTVEGSVGQPTTLRTVAAYRRHINDLPVWGRATVHFTVGIRDRPINLGVEWRQIAQEVSAREPIIHHRDAAPRVVRELQAQMPENETYISQFEPRFFALGYFSLPRRKPQGFLSPAYVAMFAAKDPEEFSKVIVVSATATPFESFRPAPAVPPAERFPIRAPIEPLRRLRSPTDPSRRLRLSAEIVAPR